MILLYVKSRLKIHVRGIAEATVGTSILQLKTCVTGAASPGQLTWVCGPWAAGLKITV